jgi:hypothetical protein
MVTSNKRRWDLPQLPLGLVLEEGRDRRAALSDLPKVRLLGEAASWSGGKETGGGRLLWIEDDDGRKPAED